MDRRERSNDLVGALLAAMRGWEAEMWSALPATVVSFDPVKATVKLQPGLAVNILLPDGTTRTERLPLLVDCPVKFPLAGGFGLTFPIAPGDEGLVVFSSRCIDAWHQNGGVNIEPDKRMHDLSDGFFLPGISSVPNVYPSISTTDVQLRNKAGDTYLSLAPDKTIRAVTPGNLVATVGGDATVSITGSLSASANAATVYVATNAHVTTDGSLTATVGTNLTATVGGTATLTATTEIKLTAPLVTINAGQINIAATTGMDVTSPAATNGSGMGTGGVHFSGTINQNSTHSVQQF